MKKIRLWRNLPRREARAAEHVDFAMRAGQIINLQKRGECTYILRAFAVLTGGQDAPRKGSEIQALEIGEERRILVEHLAHHPARFVHAQHGRRQRVEEDRLEDLFRVAFDGGAHGELFDLCSIADKD